MEWEAQAAWEGWSRTACKGQIGVRQGEEGHARRRSSLWQSTEMQSKQLHMAWYMVDGDKTAKQAGHGAGCVAEQRSWNSTLKATESHWRTLHGGCLQCVFWKTVWQIDVRG